MALKFGEGYVPIYLTGMRQYRAGLASAHQQLTSAVHRMDAVARQAKFGLLLAGAATAGALKIGGGFEQGMARVRALTGATGDAFQALETQALELGRTTVFTARQSADAMSYFALAGFDTTKIMQAMPATLNLAAAGQIGVAQSADIAAKIMAGMGLEATDLTHVMDVLTKAFTSSNTDLTMLGNAFRYVGPVAKASGKAIEEITAAIMAMSNAGVQGQMAGTALRNILIRLQAQPSEVKKALALLNVEIADADGNMKHLGTIVDEVRDSLQRFTPVEQQSIVAMLAGTRAMAAFSVMLDEGGDAIRNMESRLEGAAGTAQRIADVQLDTMIGSLKLLWSAIEGVAVKLAQALTPAVRDVADRMASFAASLSAANEGATNNAIAMAEVAAKWAAVVVIMPALLSGFTSLLGIVAVGGPFALGLAAAAAAVSFLGVSFAEAQIKGKDFGEVLRDNADRLLGLEDAAKRAAKAMEDAGVASDSIRRAEAPGLEFWNAPVGERTAEQAAEARKSIERGIAGAEQRIASAERRLERLRRERGEAEEQARRKAIISVGMLGPGGAIAGGDAVQRAVEAATAGLDREERLLEGAVSQARNALEVFAEQLRRVDRAFEEANLAGDNPWAAARMAGRFAADPWAEAEERKKRLGEMTKDERRAFLAAERQQRLETQGPRGTPRGQESIVMQAMRELGVLVPGPYGRRTGEGLAAEMDRERQMIGKRREIAELEERRTAIEQERGMGFTGAADMWRQIQQTLYDDQLEKQKLKKLQDIDKQIGGLRQDIKTLQGGLA